MLNEMTRLVLVNAVYFKGLWAKQFSAGNTRFESFHLNSKESKEVAMMHKEDEFGYLWSEELDADILQMPYQVSLQLDANVHMHHLTMEIRSDKCVARQFCRRANVYLHKPR
jgi:serine protease inhibitor